MHNGERTHIQTFYTVHLLKWDKRRRNTYPKWLHEEDSKRPCNQKALYSLLMRAWGRQIFQPDPIALTAYSALMSNLFDIFFGCIGLI